MNKRSKLSVLVATVAIPFQLFIWQHVYLTKNVDVLDIAGSPYRGLPRSRPILSIRFDFPQPASRGGTNLMTCSRPYGVIFSPNGKLLALIGTLQSLDSPQLLMCDVKRRKLLYACSFNLENSKPWYSDTFTGVFSRDGRHFILDYGDTRENMSVLEARTGKIKNIWATNCHGDLLSAGRNLNILSDDFEQPTYLLEQRDFVSGRLIHSLTMSRPGDSRIHAIFLSPDGDSIAETSYEPDDPFLSSEPHFGISYYGFRMRSAKTGRQLYNIGNSTSLYIAFSPSGEILAEVGNEVHLRAGASGRIMRTLRPPASASPGEMLDNVIFSADGKTVMATCDERVMLWDVRSGRLKRVIPRPGSERIYNIDSGGSLLAIAYESGSIALWRL